MKEPHPRKPKTFSSINDNTNSFPKWWRRSFIIRPQQWKWMKAKTRTNKGRHQPDAGDVSKLNFTVTNWLPLKQSADSNTETQEKGHWRSQIHNRVQNTDQDQKTTKTRLPNMRIQETFSKALLRPNTAQGRTESPNLRQKTPRKRKKLTTQAKGIMTEASELNQLREDSGYDGQTTTNTKTTNPELDNPRLLLAIKTGARRPTPSVLRTA